MTQKLKQSTAVTVKVGPFVDATDGVTAETGLTISQADVRLSKNGGNMAQKNESTALAHDEIGVYDCLLDATDTDTLGLLDIFVAEGGALPVFKSYEVVPANVWDSLYGADKLQVDTVQIGGATPETAEDIADEVETRTLAAVTVAGSVTGAVGSVTGNVGGNVVGSVGSLAAQAKADVNAEVVDVVNVDTFAQPTSVPAATTTLRLMLAWLYALGRNKITQTEDTQTLRNDADNADIGTAGVSDDATTATREKFTT